MKTFRERQSSTLKLGTEKQTSPTYAEHEGEFLAVVGSSAELTVVLSQAFCGIGHALDRWCHNLNGRDGKSH